MTTSVAIGALFILIDSLIIAIPLSTKAGDALWNRKHSVLVSSAVSIAIFSIITIVPVSTFCLFEGVIK